MKYIKQMVLILSVALVTLINTGLAQVRYKVIDLGTLGGNFTMAADINDSLQVVGYSQKANGDIRGFI
jgi:hypothetical protein